MPTAASPDLLAWMDAYKVLGVDYSADSAAIGQAHRRLAKQHHPDRFPVGSAEQRQATEHMAAINDAYGLIRKAPLRYHRVSKASDPTTPCTDTELDDDIRRARTTRKVDRWMDVENVDRWMTVALVALAVAVPVVTSGTAVFKTWAPLAAHVPQAALRQPAPLTGLSTEASRKKISAQELESQLIQSSGYFADAKLRCEPTTAGWDYICSYTPTDQTLFPRLHFGVNVDSTRMLQISRTVPFGVPIPPLGL
jgi:curved DNA-binding protein CbpA